MKTKILKKLIAALCAATMSMAVVAPAGAIQYTGTAELEQNQINTLNSINTSIQESQDALQEIKKHYMENKELDNDKKVKYVSLISSIESNLTKLNNQNVSNKSFFTGMLSTKVDYIYTLINGMKKDVINKDYGFMEEYAKKINLNIEPLLEENEKITNRAAEEKARLMKILENRENEKANKDFTINNNINDNINTMGLPEYVVKLTNVVNYRYTEMMTLIERIKKLDPSFKGNKFTDKAIKSYGNIDLKDPNTRNANLCQINIDLDKAESSLIEELQKIKLNNKKEELANKKIEATQKLSDTYRLTQHRGRNRNRVFEIKTNFENDWCKLINVKCSEENFNKDWNTSDLSKLSKEDIQKRIDLIENCIKSLDELAFQTDYTVIVPGQVSGLKRDFDDKNTEMDRLIECAKRRNLSFDPKNIDVINEYFDLKRRINNPNNENALKKAISKLDDAIKFLKQFDDGKKAAFQEWQEQANKEIDKLLDQATEEMKNSPNKTTVDALKKEFQPLLCGKQLKGKGNCWLYAICNVRNILKHFENKDTDIVKNSAFIDFFSGHNKVEDFFTSNGYVAWEDVLDGGKYDDKLNVLHKLGINHTGAEINIENMDVESLKKNMNMVKTLLLKHFANSKAPVSVGVKYDWCSDNTVGNHEIVVVGLDIRTNSVVVADSNFKELQVFSLDRLASQICHRGEKHFSKKYISMIFPSLNNKNDFHYDNNKNSWDEFKSKLLPAISK